MDNLPVFCDVDDLCQAFEPVLRAKLLPAQPRLRNPKSGLCLSEVMTILIGFHRSGYRNFKAYYHEEVQRHQAADFPGLVSYTRFIELVPDTLLPMCVYLHTRFGQCSGVSFIDSTKLSVCHNRRIWSHEVMKEFAARGKTSVDWFYGFKLHVVVNDCGELLAVKVTPGNVDDRAPVPDLVAGLFGKLFGDKGYIDAFDAMDGGQRIAIRQAFDNRLLVVLLAMKDRAFSLGADFLAGLTLPALAAFASLTKLAQVVSVCTPVIGALLVPAKGAGRH